MRKLKRSYSSWFTEEIKFRISTGRMVFGQAQKSYRSTLQGRVGSNIGAPRGSQMWRIASGSRQAFFKKIRHAGCHHPKQLAGQLAYINGKSQAILGNAFEHEDGQMVLEDEVVAELIERWSEGWKAERGTTKTAIHRTWLYRFPVT